MAAQYYPEPRILENIEEEQGIRGRIIIFHINKNLITFFLQLPKMGKCLQPTVAMMMMNNYRKDFERVPSTITKQVSEIRFFALATHSNNYLCSNVMTFYSWRYRNQLPTWWHHYAHRKDRPRVVARLMQRRVWPFSTSLCRAARLTFLLKAIGFF